jgi:hypothetical protein
LRHDVWPGNQLFCFSPFSFLSQPRFVRCLFDGYDQIGGTADGKIKYPQPPPRIVDEATAADEKKRADAKIGTKKWLPETDANPFNVRFGDKKAPALSEPYNMANWTTITPDAVPVDKDKPHYTVAEGSRINIELGRTPSPFIRNSRDVYIGLAKKCMVELKDSIPATTQYFKDTMSIFKFRLQVVEENQHWEDIEDIIQCGSMQSILEAARRELRLIRLLAKEKPWETDQLPPVFVEGEQVDPAAINSWANPNAA